MNWKNKSTWMVPGAVAVMVFVLAFALAWKLYSPQTIIELPAPQIRQSDNSLVLERAKTTAAKKVDTKHKLPDGSTLQSQATATVKPHQVECKPITLDISNLKMNDGTTRIVVSSPDGEVTGGLHIPVVTEVKRDPRWAAYALVGYDSNMKRQVFGGQVTYTKGPFVVGGGAIGGTAFVSAGVRW